MITDAKAAPPCSLDAGAKLSTLMTRERWIELARIVVTGLGALSFAQGLAPIYILWAAIAVGLFPLVKKRLEDLIREHKVGAEIFVTIATLVAVFGGETVAGAVLMVIILIAEFIAELKLLRRSTMSLEILHGVNSRRLLFW